MTVCVVLLLTPLCCYTLLLLLLLQLFCPPYVVGWYMYLIVRLIVDYGPTTCWLPRYQLIVDWCCYAFGAGYCYAIRDCHTAIPGWRPVLFTQPLCQFYTLRCWLLDIDLCMTLIYYCYCVGLLTLLCHWLLCVVSVYWKILTLYCVTLYCWSIVITFIVII